MKIRKDLKILLLQIRRDEVTKREELTSFCRYMELEQNQIDVWDCFEKPFFNGDIIAGYDALLVGGASDANVLEPQKYNFVESIMKVLNFCVHKKFPVFASCFGFQAAVLAFGGEIFHKEKDFEMGTIDIFTTESAQSDPVFASTPSPFVAVSVHKQYATEVPHNSELLAYTDQCIHSFKVKEAPFWAFQFHPEVDEQILKARLGVYKEKYTDNLEQFEHIINNVRSSYESNVLALNFINNVLLK